MTRYVRSTVYVVAMPVLLPYCATRIAYETFAMALQWRPCGGRYGSWWVNAWWFYASLLRLYRVDWLIKAQAKRKWPDAKFRGSASEPVPLDQVVSWDFPRPPAVSFEWEKGGEMVPRSGWWLRDFPLPRFTAVRGGIDYR